MFRENNDHLQKSMFCTIDTMDPRYAKEIEEGWAGQFYKHVFCKIDENLFEPLYSKDMGRPNTPVNILVGLEIIKHLWNYTDEQLMRTIRSDYEVNYALGIRELGSCYIADRTVYDFRKKLLTYTLDNPEKSSLVFQLFQSLTASFIQTLDIKTTDIRMDSTMIEPNIKKSGRLSVVFDVLYEALKVMPRARLPKVLQEVMEPQFRKRMLYQSKADAQASNLAYLLELAEKTLKIAAKVPEIRTQKEIQTLERLIDEQTLIDEKTKQRRVRANKEISANSLQSAYDTDATYRKKGKKDSSGYLANVAETCHKDNPSQMFVDYAVDKNTTSDQELMKESLPRIKESTDVERIYVDGGYTSTDEWQKAQEDNIDIAFTDMTGREPAPEKIPISAFNVNIKNHKVLSCPAGHKPLYSSFKKGSFSLRFDIHVCTKCPLVSRCPAKLKKRSSDVHFSEKSYITSLMRAKCLAPEVVAKNISMRAGIEGSISGLKIGQGLGKLWVRGKLKVEHNVGYKTLAANVKRFFKGITSLLEKEIPLCQGGSAPIFTG